jgi:hypothetical protein
MYKVLLKSWTILYLEYLEHISFTLSISFVYYYLLKVFFWGLLRSNKTSLLTYWNINFPVKLSLYLTSLHPIMGIYLLFSIFFFYYR